MRCPLSVNAYSFRRPFSTKVRLQSMWMVDKLLRTENGAMYRGAAKEGKKHSFLISRQQARQNYTAERRGLNDSSSSHVLPPCLIYMCNHAHTWKLGRGQKSRSRWFTERKQIQNSLQGERVPQLGSTTCWPKTSFKFEVGFLVAFPLNQVPTMCWFVHKKAARPAALCC